MNEFCIEHIMYRTPPHTHTSTPCRVRPRLLLLVRVLREGLLHAADGFVGELL